MTGKCEEVRTEIYNLPESGSFKAIIDLVKIDALASVNVATLKDDVTGYKDGLFQCSKIDRNAVERALKERPQPEGCSLHVDEADEWVAAAETALDQSKAKVHATLLNMASLLRQPCSESLSWSKAEAIEKFIADTYLAAAEDEKLAALLAECIPADPANAKLLAKYLKKIIVKVIHLNPQFLAPPRTKVEKGDIRECGRNRVPQVPRNCYGWRWQGPVHDSRNQVGGCHGKEETRHWQEIL